MRIQERFEQVRTFRSFQVWSEEGAWSVMQKGMAKLRKVEVDVSHLMKFYVLPSYRQLRDETLFQDLHAYCMFIGYPRSGHSLIGSLLDAHPEMLVAHELNALQYVQARLNRKLLYYLLLETSRAFTRNGRTWENYTYKVPNQWQGRFQTLRVIGDKKGEGSTLKLRSNPELLQRLKDTVGLPIKFIHVVRNPFDNISRMSLKTRHHDLRKSIEHYFSLCETVLGLIQQIKTTDLFEIRHESFIANPRPSLAELCHFLGVAACDDYLDDCASIVFQSPHKSRYNVRWNSQLVALVNARIERYPFLSGYNFEA